MKRALAFILAALMLLSFAGCHPPAGGSRPDLFVVATHSLLGVWGSGLEDTMILEEDDFGRVMFAYLGRTRTSDNHDTPFNILAVVVAQRPGRGVFARHSYFYDGVNVIFCEVEVQPEGYQLPYAHHFLNEDFVMEHFFEEQLEQLKAENSWNEELNRDKFFRVRVARGNKSRHMTNVFVETQREAFWDASSLGRALSHAHLGSIPLTMDKNGNVIYFWERWIFMFDSDGELIEGAVMELTDLWDYRDELREFKEANGWAFTYR